VYLKNLVVADEGVGTVYRDQKRIKLWDFVSKVITYVECHERRGIPYAVEWRLSFISRNTLYQASG